MPTPSGISGSRAAAIIGLSKYSTPFTVWQDIQEQRHGDGWNESQGYIYEPFQGNSITEFGHAFEDSVVYLTEKKFECMITEREKEYQRLTIHKGVSVGPTTFINHQPSPLITCHIDGIINDKLYEGKHTNHRVFDMDWGEPDTDRVPTAIQCQVQHNLLLTGLTEAVVSVLVIPKTVQDFEEEGWQAHRDNINGVHFLKNHNTDQIIDPLEWAKVFAQIGNFHTYNINANNDVQKTLLELYDEFWNKYVLTDTPPDAVDYSDIKRMFSAPQGVLIVGEEQAEWMREYREITREIGDSGYLSKRKDFLKTQILKFAREQTTVDDEEAVEKVVFRDESGNKLGQYGNGRFLTPRK
jgi:predicted phage-related endonuclease